MKEYGEVYENVDLKKYNSYQIGGKARYLIKVYPEKLEALLKYLEQKKIKWYVLGGGTNVILPDNDFDGVILKLDYFNKWEIKDDVLTVGSGLNLSYAIKKTFSEGYGNLVNLYGIPGSIGGAIIGNVGSFGSCLFDFLESVTLIDSSYKLKTLKKEEIEYAYRYTEFKKQKVIILEATLKLTKGSKEEIQNKWQENFQKRKETQPLTTKNAGSVFKNPEGYAAGKLIEEAGFKGYSLNGAQVSKKHANFIINFQNAHSRDIIELINLIKEKIKKEKKIDLELEQVIVKWE